MPSSLSLHWISALLGPSIERERPPKPAFLVSIEKLFSTWVLPSFRPGPETLTFFASPTSRSFTSILKGEFGMCLPILFTPTTCSPSSRGVNDTHMLPLGIFFKKHGSSRPLGAVMDAFKDLMSASDTLPGSCTSLEEPTEI